MRLTKTAHVVNFKNLQENFGIISSSGKLKLQGSGFIAKTVTFRKSPEQMFSKISLVR